MTWSRVHDIVAITGPGSCMNEETRSRSSVGSLMEVGRVTAVGARETSWSDRRRIDAAHLDAYVPPGWLTAVRPGSLSGR